ncbi:hypothetical protein [Acaryochloris marina]|uniref:hypothetical protein n=1 Tax=Acaryochloris marina TaxID=155978 RepID=UPI0028F3F97B|nr:hypothetical protein [Acaryochloris marina]
MAFFSLPWEYLGSITPFSNTFFELPLARGAEIISPNYRAFKASQWVQFLSQSSGGLIAYSYHPMKPSLDLTPDELKALPAAIV